jgi:hypothetical protein
VNFTAEDAESAERRKQMFQGGTLPLEPVFYLLSALSAFSAVKHLYFFPSAEMQYRLFSVRMNSSPCDTAGEA